MNDNKAPWQRRFSAFAGPGIERPSDMMRVTESEARSIRAELAGTAWQAPVYVGSGRHLGYVVAHAPDDYVTVLLHAGDIVGFYARSSLWIARAQRGLGLSTPLILNAAIQRGEASFRPAWSCRATPRPASSLTAPRTAMPS